MHAVALKINSGFNVYKITNNNMRKKVFLRILHPSLLKRLTKNNGMYTLCMTKVTVTEK